MSLMRAARLFSDKSTIFILLGLNDSRSFTTAAPMVPAPPTTKISLEFI